MSEMAEKQRSTAGKKCATKDTTAGKKRAAKVLRIGMERAKKLRKRSSVRRRP